MDHRLTPTLVVTLAVVLSLTAIGPVPSAGAIPILVPLAGTAPTPTTASPSVSAQTIFPLLASGTTVSPGVLSSPGDLLLAWFSIYGHEWVQSVTDSAGDTFVQEVNSSMSYGTSTARNGLSLWAAADVKGGSPVTVNASLYVPKGWTPLASASIVDVTGVATHPIDWLGVPFNTSLDPGQRSKTFVSSVTAEAGDLVLSGVAARGYDSFTATGGASRVDQSVAQSVSGKAMTMTMFDRTEERRPGRSG